MADYVADLAVLALADAEREPDVGALHTIKRGFDRSVVNSIEADAAPQPVELILRDGAMGPYPIAPQPPGCRQLEEPGQRSIIGEKQQAFGIEIESPDTDQARQIARESLENGRPALRIG